MWRHKIVADGSSEFNGPNLFSSFSTPDVLGIWTLLSRHVSYDPSDDILLCSLRCALKSKKGRLSNVLERYSPIMASGEYLLFLAYLLAHTGLSYASIISIYSTGRACDHYLFLSIDNCSFLKHCRCMSGVETFSNTSTILVNPRTWR
jgi:hypothetical protein